MTLNAKIGVSWIFGDFELWDTFQERICAESNWDRHGKAAYEIFAIERRFRWSKSQFSRLKETCARKHRRAEPQYKSLNVVGQSFVKTVADRHEHATCHNKH